MSAQILGKEGKYVTVRLASGEVRKLLSVCRATVGVVGNEDHGLVNYGKAGRMRWKGVRPTVRGSVMNPNDHPHGGGEGRTSIGRKAPMTPWGKKAMGVKTRKNQVKKKLSKLGQDVQQSSLNLSNIHLQYITEKNIFLFTLLKTWLVIN